MVNSDLWKVFGKRQGSASDSSIDHFKVNAAMSPGGANLLGRARSQALNANGELSEQLLSCQITHVVL